MSAIQQTSRLANEASKPHREINHDKILKALDKLPNNEGTADSIAAFTTLDKIEVSRRMSELFAKGLVFDTGRKGITAKGCKAILWRKQVVPTITQQLNIFQ